MFKASFAAFTAVVAVLALIACQPKASKEQAAFGGVTPSSHAFVGKIYYLPENTPKLPDFRKMAPHGTIFAPQLNVPDQDFNLGFPGVTNRTTWFAIDYKGAFSVDKPGKYNFRLSSDDGSKLWIDGKVAVDNDGVHPTVSTNRDVSLTAGRHSIEVAYFQGPPVRVSLQLFCTGPGGKEVIFPGCGLNLTRPGGMMMWLWLVVVLVLAAAVLIWSRRRRPPDQDRPTASSAAA
jgi:hypothetical protein